MGGILGSGPKPQPQKRENIPGRADEASQNAAAQQTRLARKRRGRRSLITASRADEAITGTRKTLG